MAQKIIQTSIEIDAGPERVWQILTDFTRYPDWNPFLLSVTGPLREGETLAINAGGMQFRPEIIRLRPGRELVWKGKLLFRGLFDGRHSFKLEALDNDRTLFRHEEQFSGLLVGLFARKLETDTRAGFEAMNQKLKELAEGSF